MRSAGDASILCRTRELLRAARARNHSAFWSDPLPAVPCLVLRSLARRVRLAPPFILFIRQRTALPRHWSAGMPSGYPLQVLLPCDADVLREYGLPRVLRRVPRCRGACLPWGAESSKRAAPPVQCSAVQWPHRPLASVHPFAVASRPAAAPRNATRLARAATCVLVSPRPFGFGLCARDGHSTPATLSPQVPFVFGYPNEIRSAPEQRISAAMGCYWSNFIEWGNPNDLDHPVQCAKRLGLPAWPMVGDEGDAMSLSIDASNATVFAVMPQLRKDKCDLYAQYPDSGI